MLTLAARWSCRRPWLVIAAWTALFLIALVGAARIGDVLTGSLGRPDPTSDSAQVARIADVVPGRSGQQLLVVIENTDSDAFREDQDTYVQRLGARLDAVPGVSSVVDAADALRGEPGFADPGGLRILSVSLSSSDSEEAMDMVEPVRAATSEIDRPAGTRVDVTGGPAVNHDIVATGEQDTRRAELLALPLTAVALVLAFGAFGAVLVPLLVGALSVVVALGALYFLHDTTGLFLNVFSQTIASMMGLAVGIDYSLIMVTRFRENLGARRDPALAAHGTVLTAGRTVVYSGLTVAISMAALLVPDSLLLRSLGITGILTVGTAVLLSVTLVPAILTLAGERINAPQWLSRPMLRRVDARVRFWERFARRVMRRPVLGALCLGVLLTVLALPMLAMQVGTPGAEVLPERAESRQGAESLQRAGMAGATSPLDVAVDTGREGGFYDPQAVIAVDELTREILQIDGVGAVVGPTTGPESIQTADYAAVYSTGEAARYSELGALANQTVATGGRHVVLVVFPDALPTTESTRALTEAIRAKAADLGGGPLSSVLVGGQAQEALELFDDAWSGFPVAIGVTLVASFLLLAAALRSLLLPLKAVLLNLTSVLASFGILVMVFQWGWLGEFFAPTTFGATTQLDFLVPILLFAVVFGLSMDYELFLMTRIQEFHHGGANTEDATARALGRTAPLITWAAAIMLSVFAAFVLVPTPYMKQLGLPLAVSIAIDATLVRMVLVPAFMKLAGEWNWWMPSWLTRALPRLPDEHGGTEMPLGATPPIPPNGRHVDAGAP